MSSRDRPRDDDLEERLDELEDVLAELRRDLKRDERSRTGPPRPPRLSELLRFTEQYTSPTLIAVLETTIKSLELLRGTLRLADPGRGLDVDTDAGATADRLAGVRDEASAGLVRSLSELRTALSEADLPEEAASRSLIQDARHLTAEIESRIEESRHDADAARRRTEDSIGGRSDRRDETGRHEPREGSRKRSEAERDERTADVVHIDVSDPADATEAEDADDGADDGDHGTETNDDPTPEVDIESELESIKRQIDEPDASGSTARDDDETEDGSDRREADGSDSDADGGSNADGGSDTDGDVADSGRDDGGNDR